MGSAQLFDVLAKAAGIGGIALGVFVLLFRDFIRKNIFPNLTKQQAYRLLVLFLSLTFVVALAGIGAWVIGPQRLVPQQERSTEPQGSFRRVFHEGFDGTVDKKIWLVGKRDDWEGTIARGRYELCNIADNGTASFTNRLIYVESKGAPIDQSDAQVSVQVGVRPPNTSHSGAGVLFRVSDNGQRYLAFVLNPGNAVSLLQRDGASLKVLWSKEMTAKSELVSLRVVGKGADIDLYVDSQHVHTARDVAIQAGEPGMFAYSRGCFVFDNYAVYLPVLNAH